MGSILGKIFKAPRVYADLPKTVTGPDTTGTNPSGSFRPAGQAETSPSWTNPEIFAFAEVVRDNPDRARSIVRDMSSKDRAVLSFDLSELSRIVQEEDEFRTMADRRAARLSHEGRAYPDGYDG